jgi:hypothetical protein
MFCGWIAPDLDAHCPDCPDCPTACESTGNGTMYVVPHSGERGDWLSTRTPLVVPYANEEFSISTSIEVSEYKHPITNSMLTQAGRGCSGRSGSAVHRSSPCKLPPPPAGTLNCIPWSCDSASFGRPGRAYAMWQPRFSMPLQPTLKTSPDT